MEPDPMFDEPLPPAPREPSGWGGGDTETAGTGITGHPAGNGRGRATGAGNLNGKGWG